MNLKQFEAFQAIMAVGSTIAAAARLGLSQSATSRLLTQLEESLGLSLFVRRKGRLLATPDAEELLAQINRVVEEVQRVQRLADALRVGGIRKTLIKVGVPISMAQQLMPRVVADFIAEHANTVVEIVSGSYEAIERAVLDGSADIGFVRVPSALADFDIVHTLATEAVCVLPLDHPLSARAQITLDDLRKEPLVLLGRQRALRTELDLAFRAAQFIPKVRIEVHSAGAACGFVAQGLGISIINSLLASHFSHLPIVCRPFRPRIAYTFGLAFRADQPRAKVLDDFARHFIGHLAAHE